MPNMFFLVNIKERLLLDIDDAGGVLNSKFRGKEEQYSREDGFIDHRDSSCYSFMPDSFGVIMFMEGNQYPIAGFLHLT